LGGADHLSDGAVDLADHLARAAMTSEERAVMAESIVQIRDLLICVEHALARDTPAEASHLLSNAIWCANVTLDVAQSPDSLDWVLNKRRERLPSPP
jgi:hypothetical protein